jgi:hypothetical protein
VIRHLGDSARLQERLREALAAATGALRIFSRQWVAASAALDRRRHRARRPRPARRPRVPRRATSWPARRSPTSGCGRRGRRCLTARIGGILRQHELVPAKQVEEHVAVLRAAHWDSRNAGGARDQHGGLSRAALANGLTLWSQQQPMAVAHQTEVVAGPGDLRRGGLELDRPQGLTDASRAHGRARGAPPSRRPAAVAPCRPMHA